MRSKVGQLYLLIVTSSQASSHLRCPCLYIQVTLINQSACLPHRWGSLTAVLIAFSTPTSRADTQRMVTGCKLQLNTSFIMTALTFKSKVTRLGTEDSYLALNLPTKLKKRRKQRKMKKLDSPVVWGFRIRQLRFWWGVRSLRVSWYNTKPSDGEAIRIWECGVPLPYYYSHFHSDPEWLCHQWIE